MILLSMAEQTERPIRILMRTLNFCGNVQGACPGKGDVQPCISCLPNRPNTLQAMTGGIHAYINLHSASCRCFSICHVTLSYVCTYIYVSTKCNSASRPDQKSIHCKKHWWGQPTKTDGFLMTSVGYQNQWTHTTDHSVCPKFKMFVACTHTLKDSSVVRLS